jgi:hypothetical protein
MSKLVVLVTPLLEEAHEVVEAWQQIGVPGVTLIESYGLRQLKEASQHVEVLSGMMSMLEIMRSRERASVILFSLIKDSALVDRLIDAVDSIIGDLNGPDNGILFVIDVERAVGLRPYE